MLWPLHMFQNIISSDTEKKNTSETLKNKVFWYWRVLVPRFKHQAPQQQGALKGMWTDNSLGIGNAWEKISKDVCQGMIVCAFFARLREGWIPVQRELKRDIYPFLGFASQSDWSQGYTQLLLFALTSFSTLFLQLSSKSTQHIMVLQSARCQAALAKYSQKLFARDTTEASLDYI